jgi:MYXO-CTERM domain-containing protein
VLAANGLKDVMGNALPEEVLFRFSTGTSIVIPPPDEPEPPMGGTGGIVASGGTGGTNASGGTGGTNANATGGTNATASGGASSGSDEGCACGVVGRTSRSGAGLALLMLGWFGLRRRARRT